MATELGRLLSEQLANLPADHPDRAHLEGMLRINQAYLGKGDIYKKSTSQDLWLEVIEEFNKLVESEEYVPGVFGEKVGDYRSILGMKQRALARRIGMTPSHLNKIEKGTRSPPTVEKVVSIIQELRLTPFEAVELVHLAGFSPIVLTSIDLDSFRRTQPKKES